MTKEKDFETPEFKKSVSQEIDEKFTDKEYFAKHFIAALSESKSMTDAIENIIKKGWMGKIFNVLLFIFGCITTALIGKFFK